MESFNTISGKLYSRNGNIVRDSYGILHCVYQGCGDNYSEPRIYYIKSEDNGVTWVNDEQLSNNDSARQAYPKLCIDSNDNMYLVWLGVPVGETISNVIFRKYTNGSWGDIEVLTDVLVRMGSVDIAVDGNDVVHLAYSYQTVGGDYREQLYYRTYNGSWSSESALTSDIEYRWIDIHMAIAPDNSIHLVCTRQNYRGWDSIIQYRKKVSEGSWSTVQNFQINGYESFLPRISIDANQKITIVGVTLNGIYSSSYINSWSSWEEIYYAPNGTSFNDVTIVCSNYLHVIYSTNGRIYTATYITSWSNPVLIDMSWYSSWSQYGPLESRDSYWPRIDNKSYNRPTAGKSTFMKIWINNSYGAVIYYANDVVYPTIDRIPVIETIEATDTNSYSTKVYGDLTYGGSTNITRMGFCLLADSIDDPTINDIIVDKDSPFSLGEYNVLVKGLLSNTTYKIRAFAINSIGVAYGDTITITTNNIKGLLIKF